MNRVLVIGSPGAGKSTLAARLAPVLDLPLIHLDRLFHDSTAAWAGDAPAWRRWVVEQLITRERWLIDGHYPATLTERLTAADTVIHLDYPVHVCLTRALRRRWRDSGRQKDMPDDWRPRLTWSLIRSIVGFRHETLHLRALLAELPDLRLITLPDDAAVEDFLRRTADTVPVVSVQDDRSSSS